MGTTSSHHSPYVLGYTHPTMDVHNGSRTRKGKLIPKSILSSDCGLQLAHMKSDLLVIADQQAAVNTFSGLVHTARQANKVGGTRRQFANSQEGRL